MDLQVGKQTSVCVSQPEKIFSANVTQLFLEAVWWCDASSLWVGSFCHWRQIRCREILGWASIPPLLMTDFHPPRCWCLPPQSMLYQGLPPEFGNVEGGMACLQSWPHPHWTFMGLARVCSLCLNDQHSHIGWLDYKCRLRNRIRPSWWPASGGSGRLFLLCRILQQISHVFVLLSSIGIKDTKQVNSRISYCGF